ncbi:hypothetical protein SKAU_G00021070 [Synaphobranchus kaupii]|uniref:Uncharacterized protein n=1 Tax=Synaphobranchus kaupii TaxID=118154 RepID=A0A9Q1JEK9_SYNKA|nr:hypothetical protein SKAU_G00021070 [Synaphobranchus kaupii]
MVENGTMVFAADGLFGLPRKKSSRESFEASKHGERMFLDQEKVDKFVVSGHPPVEGCLGFKAGSAIQSNVQNKKFGQDWCLRHYMST